MGVKPHKKNSQTYRVKQPSHKSDLRGRICSDLTSSIMCIITPKAAFNESNKIWHDKAISLDLVATLLVKWLHRNHGHGAEREREIASSEGRTSRDGISYAKIDRKAAQATTNSTTVSDSFCGSNRRRLLTCRSASPPIMRIQVDWIWHSYQECHSRTRTAERTLSNRCKHAR